MLKRAITVMSTAAALGAAVLEIRQLIEAWRDRRSARAGARRAKPAGASDVRNLSEFTKRELYEMAQELEIEGRSSMNKSQLSSAIAAA